MYLCVIRIPLYLRIRIRHTKHILHHNIALLQHYIHANGIYCKKDSISYFCANSYIAAAAIWNDNINFSTSAHSSGW